MLQLALNPPRLDRVLDQDADLGPLVQKTRDLAALSRHCIAVLPPQLATQICGVNVRNGRLTILVTNSAAGAKLKLYSDVLRRQAAKVRGQVNSVSVRVQPNTSRQKGTGEGVAASHKSLRLSAVALARLSSLHDSLSDSAAKRALALLLEHQGVRVSQNPANAPAAGAAKQRRPRSPRN